MDDAKKEALDRALTMLVDSLEQGKEFVIEQAPLVVQELIALGRAKHTLVFFGCAVAICACGYLAQRLCKHVGQCFEDDSDMDVTTAKLLTGGASLLVISISSIIAMFSNFAPMLEAWVAPRVYILHQLKGLL